MVSFLTTINMLRRHLFTFFDKQHKQTMNQMGALRRSSQKLNNYEEIQEKVACFHATHHGALPGWRCDA